MRALILALAVIGCGESDVPYKPIAEQFAKLLVARDFTGAHAMLAPPPALSRDDLQTRWDEMMKPAGKARGVHVMQTMSDWPDKQKSDLGWAYVAIEGEEGGEGLTLVITRDKRIRTIEWGRP